MRPALPLFLVLLPLAACSENGLSAFEDGVVGRAALEVAPPFVDFGATAGDAPVTRDVLLRSVGETPLTIDHVELVMGDESFTVQVELPQVLEPGETGMARVTFQPRRANEVVGMLHVHSDDVSTSVLPVDLSGEGLVPELRIDPPDLDFGEVDIGCVEDARIGLENVGAETLTISDLAFDAHPDLTLTDAPALPLVLEPGTGAEVGVRYVPSAEEAADATLTVDSDDPRGLLDAIQVGDGSYAERMAETFTMPEAPPVDILFAIDQSCSMEDDATRLGNNFTTFVNEIDRVTTGWQVGVATRDTGCFRDGILSASRWNYQDLFRRAVLAWDGGAYTESLLTVARNALRESGGGCNAGFTRPDAMLHVILVSDEPEQSRTGWRTLVDEIRGLHPTSPDRVKISAVAGDYPRGCGTAMAGEGYYQAADDPGGESLSICDSNWARHVEDLAAASVDGLGRFDLAGTPDLSTLEVFVDSVQWNQGFHVQGSTLVFDQTPPEGSEIRVEYGRLGCR
jgi:hypothetical protein